MYTTEACIDDTSNILVAPAVLRDTDLIRDFKTVYLCGDVSMISDRQVRAAARVFVIRELSHGYREDVDEPWTRIDLGRVPVRVHGVGVYYRRLFDLGDDYFGRIRAEHAFQSLTESTKPGSCAEAAG